MWSALAVLAIASAVYGELSKNQKRCLLEIEPGNCTEGEDSNGWKRYGYDAEKGECIKFKWHGCRMNLNHFKDRSTCESLCKGVKPLPTTTTTTTTTTTPATSEKTGPKCKKVADLKKFFAEKLDSDVVKDAFAKAKNCRERNSLIKSIRERISRAIRVALIKEKLKRKIKADLELRKEIREEFGPLLPVPKPRGRIREGLGPLLGRKFPRRLPSEKMGQDVVDFRKTNRVPTKSKSIEQMEKAVNKKIASKEVKKAFSEAKTEQHKKALKKAIEKEVGEAIKKVIVKEKIKRIISPKISPEKKPELDKILSKLEKIEIGRTVLHPVKDKKGRRASEKGGKLFPFGEKKRAKNIVEEVKKKVNEKVASKEVREAFAQAKSKKDEKVLRKTLEKEVAKAIKKAIITEKSKRTGKMGKEEKHDKIHEEITIVERRKPKLPSFGIKFGTKKILPFKDDVTIKIFTAVPKIFDQDRTNGPKLEKFEPKDRSNPCRAPIKTGRCKAAHNRYGYDAKLGKCVSFIYGGCGGNKNNFETMLECKKTCEASAPLDIRI